MAGQEQQKKKKSWGQYCKGALKKAFSIHGHYIFPFSRKGLLTTALCTTLVAPIMNAVVFPTAEDFADKYDIPEHAVTELTGNVHTVVRSGVLGRVAQAYDIPPLISLWAGNVDFSGHIIASNAVAYDWMTLGGNTCRITINGFDENMETKETLGFFSRLMERQIDTSWLSQQDQKDLNLFVLFHELRHCHPDNDATDFREGDADYYAIKMVEKLRPQSNIRDIVMTLRSLDRGEEHDTVLYLDDRFNRGGKTSTAEIKKYSKFARDFIASDILFVTPKADRNLPTLSARQVRIYKQSLQKVTR